MATIYFYCLVAVLAYMFLPTIRKPTCIFEYPQFMAAVFLAFIVPQAVSLLRFPGSTPAGALTSVLLMCCLCAAMCWAGYRVRLKPRALRLLNHQADPARLFIGGLVFVACGYFFNYLISLMSDEETGGSMWSGKVNIYGFFAQLIYPGFAICLITALRQRNQIIPWMAVSVAAILPIEAIVLRGRREPATQFVLTILLTLFYVKRWSPPRWLVVGAVFLAMLAIPAAGTYRTIATAGAWDYLPNFSLLENFDHYVNSESSILELRNAALLMEATKRTNSYEYGTAYWDQLVFRFVPAQIVGAQTKQALMFHTADERAATEELSMGFGYDTPTGSTLTGVGDVFRQFGYFGCLFFAVLGICLRPLYELSLRPDATFAQLFYIQIATSPMRAVTHQTVDFLPGIVYNAFFLGLIIFFANARVTPRRQRTVAPPVRVPAKGPRTA